MVTAVGPDTLAWKLRTQTVPEPLMPAAPGGGEALMVTLPGPASLCTSPTACPSRPRKSPLSTLTSDSAAGSYWICMGTDQMSVPPPSTTGTLNVAPTATGPGSGGMETLILSGGGVLAGPGPTGGRLASAAAIVELASAAARICAMAAGAADSADWPGTVPTLGLADGCRAG